MIKKQDNKPLDNNVNINQPLVQPVNQGNTNEVNSEVNKIDQVIKDPEVAKILKMREDTSIDNDEFTLDPFTGGKTFKLDENGCRKGWTWNYELGRCVPVESIQREARSNKVVGIDNTNPNQSRTALINKQLSNKDNEDK